MMDIRRAHDRGPTRIGWLDSLHTFSFGQYHDPDHMGVGPLRVINEDRVIPGAGFATHGHRDMEIISYVLEGALEHADSIGTGSVIRPGDVQRMSAGTGIRHSEFNHSDTHGVHFLQIWILPERAGIAPGYEQKHVPEEAKRGRLALVASRDGRDGSVTIHQDASIYAGLFEGDETARLPLRPGRILWVQVARGAVSLNGERLEQGDGARIEGTDALTVSHGDNAEILVFDLPHAPVT